MQTEGPNRARLSLIGIHISEETSQSFVRFRAGFHRQSLGAFAGVFGVDDNEAFVNPEGALQTVIRALKYYGDLIRLVGPINYIGGYFDVFVFA